MTKNVGYLSNRPDFAKIDPYLSAGKPKNPDNVGPNDKEATTGPLKAYEIMFPWLFSLQSLFRIAFVQFTPIEGSYKNKTKYSMTRLFVNPSDNINTPCKVVVTNKHTF